MYLMGVEGLRKIEVHRACVEDINWDARAIMIRGKGEKGRISKIQRWHSIITHLSHHENGAASLIILGHRVTVNDTSSVVAAGYSYSEAAGGVATIVKLTRALMIIPVCLIFALLMAREEASNGAGFNFKKIFPWFILWFVVASIVNTTGILPEALSQTLGNCGKFAIVMAMTAIGLNTRLGELVKHGLEPVSLGLCC